jgi:hypothetical protein
MRIASVATTITVTSESPVLDTRKQTSGTTFTQEELSGSARGVEGGVPGGVVGGVIGGSPSGSKKSRDREEKERVRASSAALVAQQVQQGLKSLPIDIPSEGKLFVVEGRLFFGEEPSVRVQYKQ